MPEDRALAADERAEIDGHLPKAYSFLKLDPESVPAPAVVVRAINEDVRDLRDGSLPEREDAEGFAVILGCLLGEQWCAEFGWEWRLVIKDGVDRYGVVDPERRFAYFPMSDIYRLLTDAEDELNLMLSFNMYAGGGLGPAEPGQYRTFG